MPRFKAITVAVVMMTLTLGGGVPVRADSGVPMSQQNEALMYELRDKIHQLENLFQLEMYGVFGCMAGATMGVVTGVLHLSGFSTLVMPYISTGCAFGFLVGPAAMMTRDYINYFLLDEGGANKAGPAVAPPMAPVAPPLGKQGAARPGPMGWGGLGALTAVG
ncbi:membrane hypothetical protein [uncultured Gammaproteobacteria bacterium]